MGSNERALVSYINQTIPEDQNIPTVLTKSIGGWRISHATYRTHEPLNTRDRGREALSISEEALDLNEDYNNSA